MVTLQNAENALKSVYLGAVTELLNTNVNPLLAKIEQTTADVWGKDIRTACKVGINGGIGAGDEDGNLPSPSGNTYLQFVSTLKNLYGQIEISDKAIRASNDSRGAFTDLLNAEIEGLINASRFNLGRMLYGDGSGVLCNGKVISAGNKMVVTSCANIMEGMLVDVYDILQECKSSKNKIVAIDRNTKTVTFANRFNEAIDECLLVVQGSMGKELTGIEAIFNTALPLYGVSRREHPYLNPYINNNVGKLDEIKMQQVIDTLESTANSKVNFIACSSDAKYAYQDYMSQYKRNIDIMELKGGYKTLSFNGIPVVYDRFIANSTMYFLDTTAFKLHQLCDWRFLENENGKILHQTQGKPTYTATLVKYCDLICSKPNGQGKLSGITR